jgi:regulator of sirC expression with transglutaminase-like and TPR domain
MHEDARLGLAILNSKDGRPKEAMEQLDALVHFYPNHAKHYLARCGLLEQRKDYEKAKKDISMALELEPENPECYLTRASLYLAMKKKKLAQQDCRTAIRLGASPEEVTSILGGIK